MSRSVATEGIATQSARFIARQQQRQLLKAFQIAIIIFIILGAFTLYPSSIESLIAACLIAFAALLPGYLWCSGRALGMPIFPVFALTYLWTYALPLVSNHPEVVKYSPGSHLLSGITVAGFLGIGTMVWFKIIRASPKLPAAHRALEGDMADVFLLASLAANVFFSMGLMGGWLDLEGGIFSLIRGVLLGLLALSVFVLAYRWGRKELTRKKLWVFLSLLILYILTSSASLLLVGALSAFLLAGTGFVVGRRRVAWLPITLMLASLIILHYGKTAMREKYLQAKGQEFQIQPWEYPAFFSEWGDFSLRSLLNLDSESTQQSQPFAERASLVHLFLMVQERTPDEVPYLLGSTYTFIPELLVPRFINLDKPMSHEGTTLLNIHYGKQKRGDTFRTTIGWGLLNEAYANFGQWGCAGLAVILGALYGGVARWCMNTSILSSRSLFAVLLMSIAFQTEFSASVYVTALFQSAVPLIVITLLFMKPYHDEEAYGSK